MFAENEEMFSHYKWDHCCSGILINKDFIDRFPLALSRIKKKQR